MAVDPHIRSLFSKYLENSTTQEEFQELLQHSIESDDEEFRRMFRDAMSDDTMESIVPHEVLDEVSDTVAQTLREKIQTRRKSIMRRWMPYAAACILVLLSFSAYFMLKQQSNTTELYSAYGNDALPGTNKATITLSDGSRYELSDDKDGINVNEQGIQYNDGSIIATMQDVSMATVSTPNGGQYRMTLQDGTKVVLNASSSITYPTKFTGNERDVKLEGEAYFEVAKNKQQPFLVESGKQTITVLGTHFNVQAYPNEQIETTLAEGSVKLNLSGGNKNQIILKPNQQASLQNGGFKIRQVDAAAFTAWTQNTFVFSEQPLSEIIKQLERWYDVEITYPPEVGNEKFYAEIPRDQKLSQVLKSIGQFNNLKFKIEGRRVSILK
ncbi:DUF4974 domain-containing protein [Sphingobacterium sp. KU25419]|nr:DUF4974 domain-containing protein [Sphingobacterium sp. KU25419]